VPACQPRMTSLIHCISGSKHIHYLFPSQQYIKEVHYPMIYGASQLFTSQPHIQNWPRIRSTMLACVARMSSHSDDDGDRHVWADPRCKRVVCGVVSVIVWCGAARVLSYIRYCAGDYLVWCCRDDTLNTALRKKEKKNTHLAIDVPRGLLALALPIPRLRA
jgi:hypothetical protein